MRTLRELLDDAHHQVLMYRSPSIDEFQTRISEVLVAMEHGSLEHDKITRISEAENLVRIETSWMVRQCAQTSEYEFPSTIIDAEDPVRAARIWRLEQQVKRAQTKYDLALREQNAAVTALAQANADLAMFNRSQG